MASGTTTPRVRLVRCPKCRLLLPEVEDVPLYKCGGCYTILVAKNRKAIVKSASLYQEIGAADSDKPDYESENGESTSSTSQEVHLSQESGSRSGKHDENLSTGGNCNDRNMSGDIDCKNEKLDENGSNEGQKNGSGQLQLESSEHCNVQPQRVSIEGFLPTVLHHEHEEVMLVAEANDEKLQLEVMHSELKTNNNIDSNIRGSSFDKPYAADSDLVEQPQRSEHQGFDHVRSTDSFETADFASLSSELSETDIELLSKSAITGTSHAYDGSISSFDGMDDQFHVQQTHSFQTNYKDANYLVPEERQRRDKLPAKGSMNSNARNLSSGLSNKMPYGTAKYSKWHRDEAFKPITNRRPLRYWTKQVRDEYPSRFSLSQIASLRKYENGDPSHELCDEFPEYREQESMKLLRMVRELQDQIIKRCNLNGRKSRGRTSIDVPRRQKHFPTYYYPGDEIFYPRQDIDNSCLCCHPRVRTRSEQLPPPVFRHNRGFCRAHSGQCCHDCYNYLPSSPHRYKADFSSWSHEIISDDQKRYRDRELKRYFREKHYSVRRHCRPKAGGAPFVTCYHCFIPLELPANFLLSKRRFHQLRCGACLKVLTFLLQNGTHIVPYEEVGCRTSIK